MLLTQTILFQSCCCTIRAPHFFLCVCVLLVQTMQGALFWHLNNNNNKKWRSSHCSGEPNQLSPLCASEKEKNLSMP